MKRSASELGLIVYNLLFIMKTVSRVLASHKPVAVLEVHPGLAPFIFRFTKL